VYRVSHTFKSKGLKLTPQRIAVYEYLLGTRNHPSAEVIYSALIEKFPTMSLATVYKSLKTLCKVNLIQELNLGEGNFRYDAIIEDHAHFQCNCCNVVIDLMNVPTDKVMDTVSKNQDFLIESSKLYFYGTCMECQKKSS
jgi:Fur family peroxide stress response transcriptional regulator